MTCVHSSSSSYRRTCRCLCLKTPPVPPFSNWIQRQGRLVLVYTIDKSCAWNCRWLRAHFNRVHLAHRYTAVRIRLVLDAERELSHGYSSSSRHFKPHELPWPSLHAWMQLLTTDKSLLGSPSDRLQHVLWDIRLSRAQNSFQCRPWVDFLTHWSLERGIDFDFTDYMIALRWLRWLRRTHDSSSYPQLKHSPAVLWISLHNQSIDAEAWWERYMPSISLTLNCWFNQVKRPGFVILHHQPTENMNNLEEVILLFKCFLEECRHGDNDNQLVMPREETKDNIILRLDLTPWQRGRLWHLFAKCFNVLWVRFGILIMPECPKLVLPPGREAQVSSRGGLAAGHNNPLAYFHHERLSHLTCIDIMVNRWYSNPHDATLRSYKFKLHNQHVQLLSDVRPYICNTDAVVPEPLNQQQPGL